MVQPKMPPLSIRLPADVLDAVDALAARRGIKRHAALIEALRSGLFVAEAGSVQIRGPKGEALAAFVGPGDGRIAPPLALVAKVVPSKGPAHGVPMRMPRAPIGSLAKKPKGKG